MWLVFCEPNDIPALWAARGLEARGLKPLEVITPQALVYNKRIIHTLIDAESNVIIELSDGRAIYSATVLGTLNRLQLLPTEHLSAAKTTDRNYAEQEIYSLFLSWLYALPDPVLNRPTPQGLSGAWRHLSEWFYLADKAGLSTLRYHQSDSQSTTFHNAFLKTNKRHIIVINDKCCGSTASSSVINGCVRLAEMSGTSLLGVDFTITPNGNWNFVNATPFPDLRLGGEDLLDTLSLALRT